MTDVVDAYLRAWNTHDEPARRELLDQAITEDCELAGPTGTFRGRDAILGLIVALQGRAGDAVMARAGPVEVGDDIRFAWQVRTPAGEGLLGGTDTVEVAADGRLRRIAVSI